MADTHVSNDKLAGGDRNNTNVSNDISVGDDQYDTNVPNILPDGGYTWYERLTGDVRQWDVESRWVGVCWILEGLPVIAAWCRAIQLQNVTDHDAELK